MKHVSYTHMADAFVDGEGIEVSSDQLETQSNEIFTVFKLLKAPKI